MKMKTQLKPKPELLPQKKTKIHSAASAKSSLKTSSLQYKVE